MGITFVVSARGSRDPTIWVWLHDPSSHYQQYGFSLFLEYNNRSVKVTGFAVSRFYFHLLLGVSLLYLLWFNNILNFVAKVQFSFSSG